MKTRHSFAFALSFVAAFCFVKSAHADYFYNGNDVNGAFLFPTYNANPIFVDSAGATSTVSGTTNELNWEANASTTGALGAMTQINKVSVLYQKSVSTSIGLNLSVACSDGTGNHSASLTNVATAADLAIHTENFVFGSPMPCDTSNAFATLDFTLSAVNTSDLQSIKFSGTSHNSFPGLFWYSGYTSNFNSSVVPIFALNSNISYTGGGTITQPPTQQCGTTNFAFLGVDFGQEVCKLVNFLFVPSPDALNAWTNTQTTLSAKAPFSYLYEIGTDLTTLPTSTTATLTPMTLTIGATGTPINFSFDAFSANTIDKYTTQTVRSVLRTLVEWALYLAFLAMIILEVRKLFSKPKE